MIISTQTIIGSLSMLQQRVPDASGALTDAIDYVKNGEFVSAIGCVNSLTAHSMSAPTSECIALLRSALVGLQP